METVMTPPSGSIKCWGILEQLHNRRLLKKGSVLWSYLDLPDVLCPASLIHLFIISAVIPKTAVLLSVKVKLANSSGRMFPFLSLWEKKRK
jgi:hypothetical protein